MVVGYYFDGTDSWIIISDKRGNLKRRKAND